MELINEVIGRSGLDLLPVGCLIVDPCLEVRGWNRTLAEWTGLSSDRAVGARLTDLFPEVANGQCVKRLTDLFQTGLPVSFSASLHGHFLPIPPRHGVAAPRMIQQTEARLLPGVRDRAIITIQDVTIQYFHLAQLKAERQELVAVQQQMRQTCLSLETANKQLQATQQSLSESREYADSILRSMVDMLVVFCPEGRITRVNEATLAKLKYREGQLTGQHVEAILSETFEPGAGDACEVTFAAWLFERLRREGSVSELECWRRDRDGAAEPVSLSGAVMRGDQGDTLGYVCVLQDTAERKRLQEELERGKRLQSVGRLAAGIAHEINTPLQCISGCLEYLDRQLPVLLDALANDGESQGLSEALRLETACKEVPDTVTDAMTAVTRVVEIVAAMRSMVYSSKEVHKPFDVNRLVRDAAVISRSHWKTLAEVEMRLDEDLPQPLGSAAEISQVLLNLIVNAADSLGEVREEGDPLGLITVRSYAQEKSVVVEVDDNGPGIPPAIRDRIFEPFFTTKDVGKGTGQGLAFSYQALRRHGGSIEASQSPTGGARFTVTLPLSPEVGELESVEVEAAPTDFEFVL